MDVESKLAPLTVRTNERPPRPHYPATGCLFRAPGYLIIGEPLSDIPLSEIFALPGIHLGGRFPLYSNDQRQRYSRPFASSRRGDNETVHQPSKEPGNDAHRGSTVAFRNSGGTQLR
jgi:hypothetical protein